MNNIKEIRLYTKIRSEGFVYHDVTFFDANQIYVHISWKSDGIQRATYIPREEVFQIVVDYADANISI